MDKMQIPLHIKTTLLASAVIVFVMAITLYFFGARVVDRLQTEQKNFAEAQAESLAEKITDILPINDYRQVAKLVEIFEKARIGKGDENNIRIWENQGVRFVKRVGAGIESEDTKIPPEAVAALRQGREAKIEETAGDETIYRVFVPIILQTRLIGAVEFTERLDSFSVLANRYWFTEIWLALTFIAVSALTIYFLTRQFVYRPLNRIAAVMNEAKGGDLKTRVQVTGGDEFGLLAKELNRMLAEIEEFTLEREKRNELLGEKVREATAELETRNRQLERANNEIWQTTSRLSELEKLAAAGQTAAQFAHEVGTPLNLISGHIQLLRRGDERDEATSKRLDVIGSQIERIEGIVRSMLDKTRFGEVKFAALDVNEILRSVLEIVNPKLQAEKIGVGFQTAAGLPLIEGNAERLQQVFLNIINNAADAMPDGGELKIRTQAGEKEVVVQIADNGAGMDEETRKQIFEPLFTTKKRGRGTGLGLVVVKQILSEHGARITVESEKNTGTVFGITFPAVS